MRKITKRILSLMLAMTIALSMFIILPFEVGAAAAISLNVPFFCQRSYGVCVNSSISMVEAYYHGYGQNNDFVYNTVMSYNPGASLSSGNAAYLGYAPISCDLQSVYNALAGGKPVIIQRDGHFSVVYAYVPTSNTLQLKDFKVLNTFRRLDGVPIAGPEFAGNVGYSDMASWLSGNTWLTSWVKVSDKIPIASTSSTVKELTISNVNYPIHKQSGQPFEVFGTISSPNFIAYAAADVYDMSGNHMFGIWRLKDNRVKVFNLNDDDANMKFSSLPDGKYRYFVGAVDEKGYAASMNVYFTVGAGATTSGIATTMTGTHDCNEKIVDSKYRWDDGVVTKEATCSAVGVKTYTCRECGKTKTEDIPKSNAHDYQSSWTVDVEPTVQSVGYKSRHCKNCSATTDVVEIAKLQPEVSFVDVSERDWFYSAVEYAVNKGLLIGVGVNTFAPNDSMTRAMLVTVLYRMEGIDTVSGPMPFVDVKSDAWYTSAVIWAYNEGIVNGITENTFAPNVKLTREQLVTMLYRYSSCKGYDVSSVANLARFPDNGKISSWAMDALSWASAVGLIGGTEIGGVAYIDPKGNATRAQVAAIFTRYITDYLETFEKSYENNDEGSEPFIPSGPVIYVPDDQWIGD